MSGLAEVGSRLVDFDRRSSTGPAFVCHRDEVRRWQSVGSPNLHAERCRGAAESHGADVEGVELLMESRLELWPDVGSEAMDRYYQENRVSDFEDWAWRSFESRVDYRQLRSSSELSYRRSSYILAAAALNRVIASVFAYQAVKSSRGGSEDDGGSEDNGAVRGGYRLDISTPALGERGDLTTRVSLIRSF